MTLCYFDVSQPIILQVDASQMSLGAAILQNGEPITYASKALTAMKNTQTCERTASYEIWLQNLLYI